MGYSVAKAASDRLKKIFEQDGVINANTWQKENGKQYVFEIGRENADGALTGTVCELEPIDGVRCRAHRKGSARIEADGRVTRFPHLNKAMKAAAKAELNAYELIEVFNYGFKSNGGIDRRYRVTSYSLNDIDSDTLENYRNFLNKSFLKGGKNYQESLNAGVIIQIDELRVENKYTGEVVLRSKAPAFEVV